jgi:hypothetical protein
MHAIVPARPSEGAALQLRRRSSERRRRETFRGMVDEAMGGSEVFGVDGWARVDLTAAECPVIPETVQGVARYEAAARLTGRDVPRVPFIAPRRIYLIV